MSSKFTIASLWVALTLCVVGSGCAMQPGGGDGLEPAACDGSLGPCEEPMPSPAGTCADDVVEVFDSFAEPEGDFSDTEGATISVVDEAGLLILTANDRELFVPANGLDLSERFMPGESVSVEEETLGAEITVIVKGETEQLVFGSFSASYGASYELPDATLINLSTQSCTLTTEAWGGHEHVYGGVSIGAQEGPRASGAAGEILEFEGWQVVGVTHMAQSLNGGAGMAPQGLLSAVGPVSL